METPGKHINEVLVLNRIYHHIWLREIIHGTKRNEKVNM